MARKGKGGFFYYSWKGLGYLVRAVLRGLGLLFLLVVLLAAIANPPAHAHQARG